MGMNGVSTVLRDDKNREKAYFWCAPAWLWLIIIVSLESILMAGWVTREYFFFDYTCLLLHQNRSNPISEHSITFGPRLIYGSPEPQPKKRNLRFLEFNASIPKFVGDIEADSVAYPYIYDTKGNQINDESAIVVDEPMILESDYQQFEDPQRRSKRSIEAQLPTPTTTLTQKPKKYVIRRRKKQPTPLTTMQSIVSIENLPISNEQGDQEEGKLLKIKTTKIKSFPQNTSTLIKRRRKKKPKTKLASAEHRQNHDEPQQHSDIHNYIGGEENESDRRRLKKLVANEEVGIQGRTLRAYKGAKGAGKKPKPKPKDPKATSAPAATPVPTLPTTSAPFTIPGSLSSSLPSDTVTQLPPNSTTPIVMSEVVIKAVAEAIEKGKDEKDKDDETTTTSTIPTTITTPGTPTSTFSGYSQDYKGEEIKIDSSHQPRAIPEHPKVYPKDVIKPEHNFQVQIETFSTLALCIARTLFDFWCVAQLIASLPFLFGICLRIRCLFIARLMLDALFLVILFIYTITIIAFSIILYILVDEMTGEVVIEWLVFGILLLLSMIIYIFTFTVTLRCCELVLNERVKPYKEKRSKSLLYTEIASDQMLEIADEV